MWNHREQARERVERLRGWITYFLYAARPRPVELEMLKRLLDKRNYPLSRRKLAEEVDYLIQLRIIRVFDSQANAEVSEIEQHRLTTRYGECESDEEMGFALCAKITAAGINFQEGRNNQEGVQRVE